VRVRVRVRVNAEEQDEIEGQELFREEGLGQGAAYLCGDLPRYVGRDDGELDRVLLVPKGAKVRVRWERGVREVRERCEREVRER